MNDSLTDQFVEVRQFMFQLVEPMFHVFFNNMWDPISFFHINKYIHKQLIEDVKSKFPNFPIKYMPKFKFHLNREEKEIEFSIQEHLDQTVYKLYYLGSCGMYGHTYDLYVRENHGIGPPILYARYGSDQMSYIDGTSEAEAEYFAGQITPLSIAYEMARDAGYFNRFLGGEEEQEKN